MPEARPAAEAVPAFLLHRRPFRDTSVLAEVFTRPLGRVGVVARGGRSAARGGLAGVLQPFAPLLVWLAGRGELATLRGAEAQAPACQLTGAALATGFYVNELLLRACAREDPHPALYDAYGAFLHALARNGVDEPALRSFELTVLREMGYAPALTHTMGGAPIEPGACYVWDAGHGARAVPPGTADGLAGAVLLALARDTLDGADRPALRAARGVLRAELRVHLGDRPWQSRRVYAALAGGGEPA